MLAFDWAIEETGSGEALFTLRAGDDTNANMQFPRDMRYDLVYLLRRVSLDQSLVLASMVFAGRLRHPHPRAGEKSYKREREGDL